MCTICWTIARRDIEFLSKIQLPKEDFSFYLAVFTSENLHGEILVKKYRVETHPFFAFLPFVDPSRLTSLFLSRFLSPFYAQVYTS